MTAAFAGCGVYSDTSVCSDMQYGVDGEVKAKRGRFHCLVAQRLDAMSGAAHVPIRDQEELQTAAAVPPFLRSLLPEHVQVCTRSRAIVGPLLTKACAFRLPREPAFHSMDQKYT